ncbi:ChbG/HpnK family deacetylase [Variovorax sp. PvP013]|uniref:ChbG/HpnK family deacetylase n=1 Tax=Variovorax sp. PvP013 TaxID=3156435 RepID=UPI003D1FEAEA
MPAEATTDTSRATARPTVAAVRAPVRIALCADDFALHPAVDDAVLRLARQGRLGATSCMTTSPRWAESARGLRADAPPTLSTGLHFNLTEGHGDAAPTLVAVLRDTYARRLPMADVRERIVCQLDAFEQAMGRAPDFVDGHQHVHQLPGVRDALLDVLMERYGGGSDPPSSTSAAGPSPMPAVRATVPARRGWGAGKAGVLAVLGGWWFRRRLDHLGIPHNTGFAGVYGFDAPTPADYGRHMERWLAGSPDGTLMMCHPATSLVAGDAIAAQRVVEFDYLSSAAFGDSLARHGVELLRFDGRR